MEFYKVASGDTIERLQAEVNRLAGLGWYPSGFQMSCTAFVRPSQYNRDVDERHYTFYQPLWNPLGEAVK